MGFFELTNNKNPSEKWQKELLEKSLLDTWNLPSFNDSKWNKLKAPMIWEDQGFNDLDGVLLFRKAFDVDANNVNLPTILELAKIDDNDITYINGIKIG